MGDRATVISNTEVQKIAFKVSWVSMAANMFLSAIKLIAGILANSGAMISDAVHSASDVLSTLLVMFGISVASKEEDEDHNYGHERMESVTALLLSIMLALTGLGIGWAGIQNIEKALAGDLAIPGTLALVAAAVSILVKEMMYWYTRRAAKTINSGALMADAWHHRSDALSSVGAFLGIGGAMMGYPVWDPVVSVLICVLILKVAFDIGKDALDKTVDTACDAEEIEKMESIFLSVDGVLQIDSLKTRRFANKVYIDLEIGVNRDLSLIAAHEIAENAHDKIEFEIPEVKHCMIHVNPVEAKA